MDGLFFCHHYVIPTENLMSFAELNKLGDIAREYKNLYLNTHVGSYFPDDRDGSINYTIVITGLTTKAETKVEIRLWQEAVWLRVRSTHPNTEQYVFSFFKERIITTFKNDDW